MDKELFKVIEDDQQKLRADIDDFVYQQKQEEVAVHIQAAIKEGLFTKDEYEQHLKSESE